MKATSIKQIKFNRGQVTDLLSERVDMGLQNACGTVYDNIYINKYGQIQNAPNMVFASQDRIAGKILCMFDTGEDYVYPITISHNNAGTETLIRVYSKLLKSDPYHLTSFDSPIASQTVQGYLTAPKVYQFGYNVLVYGQSQQPWLLNLVPASNNWDLTPVLTVKEDYFNGAFDNVYTRGLNQAAPTGFTPPTSGNYVIEGLQITTKLIATVKRNNAGSAFTQDLVGQVLLAPANGGVLQVRSVQDGDNLTAYIFSPFVALKASDSDIKIPWGSGNNTEWVFGYEKAYGDTASPNNTPSWPDSVIYVNQRLVFGGNDYHGNLLSASRIGIINDFDPESATESDAFTTAIASKDYCRIVDLVVSNNELRIACTNGEYAMSLSNLNPTSSLNGFDQRSEVGIAKKTAICDCGGLTAYVSRDGSAIYGTQFSLLKDRYQPISLTSQTENIINHCGKMVYLTNRPNSEGNCLVGVNADSSFFIGGIDINAGLIGLSKITQIRTKDRGAVLDERNLHITGMYVCGSSLWVSVSTLYYLYNFTDEYLFRFTFGEIFNMPCWYRYYAPGQTIPASEHHPNELVIPSYIYYALSSGTQNNTFRAFYYNSQSKTYEFITPTGYTQNNDGTHTVEFADNIDQTNIVVAGLVRQSDWRSVEIGVGLATRELNKRIVKLEGVIEPTQITGNGRFKGLVLTPEQAKNFITLTKSKSVETMDIDALANTSYTENQDLVWRRAFDNPDRELYYGVSMVAPFLIKSLTVTISYDEVP